VVVAALVMQWVLGAWWVDAIASRHRLVSAPRGERSLERRGLLRPRL